MSQTRATWTRRARFLHPIGGRGDASRADRALTWLSRPFPVGPASSAAEGGPPSNFQEGWGVAVDAVGRCVNYAEDAP